MGVIDCYKRTSEEEFILKYDAKIEKALHQTHHQDREDLKQEIHLKLLQKRKQIVFKEKAPFFMDSLIATFSSQNTD